MKKNGYPRAKDRCAGCIYWKPLFYFGGTKEECTRACLYSLQTGRIRGGLAKDCTVKTIEEAIPA